jgi:hypothetical protein
MRQRIKIIQITNDSGEIIISTNSKFAVYNILLALGILVVH